MSETWMKRRQRKCSSKVDTNPTSTNNTPITTQPTNNHKTMKKSLTFVLRRMNPTTTAARRAFSHTAATTTMKALATTISSATSASTTKAPTTHRMLWWLSAQRRKPWLHGKSCRATSTMASADTNNGGYIHKNSVDCPPWQVGCFLKDRTPSEDDWWCRPETIFKANNLATESCNDIFFSNGNSTVDIFRNHRNQPDVVVKSQSQVVWVLDDEDEEQMITKETLTVSSSAVEATNSNTNQYESIVKGMNNAETLTERLFRNYGNDTWHKARAAWRCTSSPATFMSSAATTSCWPRRSSASTRPLEGRELYKLAQQFQRQATDAIGEYDLPRRIRLQDVVSIYSSIWKETESDEEAEVVVDWND